MLLICIHEGECNRFIFKGKGGGNDAEFARGFDIGAKENPTNLKGPVAKKENPSGRGNCAMDRAQALTEREKIYKKAVDHFEERVKKMSGFKEGKMTTLKLYSDQDAELMLYNGEGKTCGRISLKMKPSGEIIYAVVGIDGENRDIFDGLNFKDAVDEVAGIIDNENAGAK